MLGVSVKTEMIVFSSFYEGFQQASDTQSLWQQQALAAVMKGLHTKMESLQQTSVQDNQSMQQSIQDLEVQMKEGKPFSLL